ncbi:MAG: hypothetical protein C0613_03375 [Desulfobulbaceae bacterium]|nr:MAG: hypothetical protein C0613_03375 [Desulfobulbaceae bacterium]
MTIRILVVDDDPGVRKALSRVLQGESWQVQTAAGGREALAVLQEGSMDIVISDQRMPGMSGLEFLTAVSRRYPDTMRILLTGHGDANLVLQAIADGAIYRFLTKPWDNDELLTVIRHARQAQKKKEGSDIVMISTRREKR